MQQPAFGFLHLLPVFWLAAQYALAVTPPAPRLQSIESAIQAAGMATRPVPVTVRGIVVLNQRAIIIEDRTGATEVRPLAVGGLALGDEVEVSGSMTLSPRPLVQEGAVRRLWGASMPLPLSITPDEAADGENECALVQTSAELVSVTPAGLTGMRLNLRGGHQSFSAVLPNENGDTQPASIKPGATLRLTGILLVNRGAEIDHDGAFLLALRSIDDVQVVEPPSWWNGPHLLLVSGILLILLLIAVNGYNRIEHARYRAVAEERANIARDIHDTVAQGYAGIALQLEAAEQMIERDPERAHGFLSEALQLVRHSRDESHLSIDVLRSLSRNDRLEVLVAHSIQQLQPTSHARLTMEVSGQPCPLSFKMVNNLFRIAQQAMANAVQHAAASRIVARMEYSRRLMTLEVIDDGRGFDVAAAPGANDGHYGLTGMRERSMAIGAQFAIESSPAGTRICVRVKL